MEGGVKDRRSTAGFVIFHINVCYSGQIRRHLIVLLHNGLPHLTSRATPIECLAPEHQDGHDVGGHRTKDVSTLTNTKCAPSRQTPGGKRPVWEKHVSVEERINFGLGQNPPGHVR